jgi:hypothetical protein
MHRASALFFVCAGIFVIAPTACAQEVSPGFKADVLRLFKASGIEAVAVSQATYLANAMIDAIVKTTVTDPAPDSTLSSRDSTLVSRTIEVCKDEVALILKREAPKLLQEMVPVYAKHFTQDDVRAMVAYYDSPLGKKVIREQAMLVSECTQVGEAWGRALGPTIQVRVADRLKQEGLSERR